MVAKASVHTKYILLNKRHVCTCARTRSRLPHLPLYPDTKHYAKAIIQEEKRPASRTATKGGINVKLDYEICVLPKEDAQTPCLT